MNKPFDYKGINYTIIKVTDEDITFTSDISIFTFNRNTGEGLYNTGHEIHRLCASWSPKHFSPTLDMMDEINIAINSNEFIKKVFTVNSPHYSMDALFYVTPVPENSNASNRFDGLLINNDSILSATLNVTDIGPETDIKLFLKKFKRIITLMFKDESLTKQLFKEL